MRRLAASVALAALALGMALVLPPATRAHGPTVTLDDASLSPARLTIPAGSTVHFHNAHDMPGGHTVVADDGSFESPPLARGGGWHRLFTEPGEYRYHIGETPEVRGVIIVTPD